MNIKRILGITLASTALTAISQADDVLDTRATLEQWVKTKQLISQERNDWQLEKSILQDTDKLLENGLIRVNKAIEELEETATASDKNRAELAVQKEKLTAGADVVNGEIGALETKVKAIVKKLPPPLVDKIQPLIRRLPEDPNDTQLTMGERVQNIVGILSQTDKFNTTLTISSESRKIDNNTTMQVTTLYWGLAMAYYVDHTGNYAGIGTPSENGWEWSELPGAGERIKQLIEIYEGVGDIQFVSVPSRIN